MKTTFKYHFGWMLFASSFLVLYLGELLEKSMFIDGVWYASISQNLSEGKGSLWFPQFSETIFAAFHEHPPLMFWIQSIFFEVLGGSWLTERIFNLCMYVILLVLVVLCWRKALKGLPQLQNMAYVPLIFLQVNLVSFFYLPANLFELQLIVLDLAAILCLCRYQQQSEKPFFLVLGAMFLILAFLTKGFVGLFPMAFFTIYCLVFQSSFKKMIVDTLKLCCVFLGIGALIIAFVPAAGESLSKYLDVQVLASLNGERKQYYFRENQTFIIIQLFLVLMPMLTVTLLGFILHKNRWAIVKRNRQSKAFRFMIVFFLIGLSASLPIAISPRQALPYLIPSMPFFSLAFGICSAQYFESFFIKNSKWILKFKPALNSIILIGFIGAIFFCSQKFGKSNNRDLALIEDVEKIGQNIGKKQIISSTYYDMYISGYLMRNHQISLDTNSFNHSFLLTQKGEGLDLNDYERMPLSTSEYDLYRKKKPTQTQLDYLGDVQIKTMK